MDSFSLFCLATEVDPSQKLRVLGLIEERLDRKRSRPDNQLYKGALLVHFGLEIEDQARASRFIETGLQLMRTAVPLPGWGQLERMQMTYARGLTLAQLPDPPVPYEEVRNEIARLVNHPAFHMLAPLRRQKTLAASARLMRRVPSPRIDPALRSDPYAV